MSHDVPIWHDCLQYPSTGVFCHSVAQITTSVLLRYHTPRSSGCGICDLGPQEFVAEHILNCIPRKKDVMPEVGILKYEQHPTCFIRPHLRANKMVGIPIRTRGCSIEIDGITGRSKAPPNFHMLCNTSSAIFKVQTMMVSHTKSISATTHHHSLRPFEFPSHIR